MSNMTDLWLSRVFFQALNTPQFVFGRGSTFDPGGGAYDAPPRPSSRLRRGSPHPHSLLLDLDAFGVSISAPSVPRFSAPFNTNSWLCLCILEHRCKKRFLRFFYFKIKIALFNVFYFPNVFY